jgi:hypothetical protein
VYYIPINQGGTLLISNYFLCSLFFTLPDLLKIGEMVSLELQKISLLGATVYGNTDAIMENIKSEKIRYLKQDKRQAVIGK